MSSCLPRRIVPLLNAHCPPAISGIQGKVPIKHFCIYVALNCHFHFVFQFFCFHVAVICQFFKEVISRLYITQILQETFYFLASQFYLNYALCYYPSFSFED